jgi:DNA-binding CsgD family transcriptional regulator
VLPRSCRGSIRDGGTVNHDAPVPPQPAHAILERLDGPLLEALTALPAPIWIADRAGSVGWMNLAATALLDDRTGSHFTRFVASEDVADARELFARTVHGRPHTRSWRLKLKTTLGTVAAEVESAAIRDAKDVLGVITLVHSVELADEARRTAPEPRLTPRQHQVLRLLSQGRSTTEMAADLQISEQTVRNHVRFLLAELRVRSRLEAVVLASRNKWL